MDKSWFWLIICVLTLSGCNKLDMIEGDGTEDIPSFVKEPIATKDMTVSLSLGTNFSYRWMEGDSLSLFVMREGEKFAVYPENSNVAVSYSYGEWSILSPLTLSDEQWKAYAYYPFRKDWERYNVPISVDDSIYHMVGKTNLSFGFHNNKIAIELLQPKSLLTVYVRKQGKVDRKIVESVRIYRKRSGLPRAGQLDIYSGLIEYQEFGDFKRDSLHYEVVSGSVADPIDFSILPTVQNNSVTKGTELNNSDPTMIEMEINGNTLTAQMPETVSNWVSGKQYVLNVLYNNDEIVIESVSIRNWQTEIVDVPGSNLPDDKG